MRIDSTGSGIQIVLIHVESIKIIIGLWNFFFHKNPFLTWQNVLKKNKPNISYFVVPMSGFFGNIITILYYIIMQLYTKLNGVHTYSTGSETLIFFLFTWSIILIGFYMKCFFTIKIRILAYLRYLSTDIYRYLKHE